MVMQVDPVFFSPRSDRERNRWFILCRSRAKKPRVKRKLITNALRDDLWSGEESPRRAIGCASGPMWNSNNLARCLVENTTCLRSNIYLMERTVPELNSLPRNLDWVRPREVTCRKP